MMACKTIKNCNAPPSARDAWPRGRGWHQLSEFCVHTRMPLATLACNYAGLTLYARIRAAESACEHVWYGGAAVATCGRKDTRRCASVIGLLCALEHNPGYPRMQLCGAYLVCSYNKGGWRRDVSTCSVAARKPAVEYGTHNARHTGTRV